MRRLLLVALAVTLVVGACGGNDDKDLSASKKATTTTEAVTSSTVAGETASTTVVSAPKAGTTKKSSATTVAGAPAAGPQPATAGGIKAAAPGTYTSKVTGTSSFGTPPATSTLKVEPLQGTDQKSTSSNGQSGGETVLRYQADGVYLVNLKVTGPVNKEFKLEPPGLAFAQPATIGKTWGWSVKSTDGATTVTSNFKVLRTETIAIGGEQVPTVVVETNVVADGDVKYTSKGTMWVSEAYRLIVREDTKLNGTYGGFPFSSDTSSVMQSTKPS